MVYRCPSRISAVFVSYPKGVLEGEITTPLAWDRLAVPVSALKSAKLPQLGEAPTPQRKLLDEAQTPSRHGQQASSLPFGGTARTTTPLIRYVGFPREAVPKKSWSSVRRRGEQAQFVSGRPGTAAGVVHQATACQLSDRALLGQSLRTGGQTG